MNTWEILWVLVTLLLKSASVWFVLTALFSWKKLTPYPPAPPRVRFACLIPARNEAGVIEALVESLRRQNYPEALREIYVLPNGCTDETAAMGRAAGARILPCSSRCHCKGDVLHEALGQLLREDFDAFCVFDADNLVDTNYLQRMNDAFCAGARVTKGRMLSKNPGDSWLSGCFALYYGLFERWFNRPRAALGLSAKLVGTGFAVHREVLEELGGWNTVTLAEDAEFSALCTRAGHRICYVPQAVSFDESPRSLPLSMTQRLRWVGGVMHTARLHLPGLLLSLLHRPSLRTLDLVFFLSAPYLQLLSLPGLLALWRGLPALPLLLWALTALLACCLRQDLAPRDRPGLRSALCFPLFLASWLPLLPLAALGLPRRWKPIPHGLSPLASAPAAGKS